MKIDFVCDQMITARSALLLAARITALFGRLKTDFMVSSCNKPDWGYFRFRLLGKVGESLRDTTMNSKRWRLAKPEVPRILFVATGYHEIRF